MNSSKIVTIIVVIVLVLVGYQWYSNSKPDSFFNKYGNESLNSLASTSKDMIQNIPETTPTAQIQDQPKLQNNKNLMHKISIQTNKGTIVFETYDADAPETVKNFITLAQKGFYDGIIFHRVIKDFMIQGGDPTGTGMGGPGYKFADELNPNTQSYKNGYQRGVVAMANAGPNTNGSQFFIMHKDVPLPHNYTIFGNVISGLDVVDAIANTKTDPSYRPVEEIKMAKVTVGTK